MAVKRKPRKGFTRTQKEWEKSIAGHIGKFIDNLTPKQIEEFITLGIVAYAGHQAAANLGIPFPQSLGGSATAIVGLRLAGSMNIAAGTAGIITLAGIGLCTIPPLAGGFLEGAHVVTESAEHAAQLVKEHPEEAHALAGIAPLLGISGISYQYGHMLGWW